MSNNRHGFRWNINECLRLQREFELLQLPLDEIASRHGRTVNAIMRKLHAEGFASYHDLCSLHYSNKLNNLASNDEDYVDDEDDMDDDEDEEDYDPYDIVNNIRSLQKQMNALVSKFTSKPTVQRMI
jgi:hypothetical protein